MARSRYCRICREFHDTDQPWPEPCVGHFGIRPERAGPQIISDTIEPFRSMADKRIYTSKSRYRADLRARGMIEVGNEQVQARPTALPPVRDALRQSLHQLRG